MKLDKLEILSVGNNRLTSIPESIGQLKSLNQLDLSDNELESIIQRIISSKT
ncbi:MAG: leucine-rich repeat domain-containing protein [Candidatus Thorarchaeota archaeon]